MGYDLKLFSGNANRPLAEEIAKTLQLSLGDAEVSRFPRRISWHSWPGRCARCRRPGPAP